MGRGERKGEMALTASCTPNMTTEAGSPCSHPPLATPLPFIQLPTTLDHEAGVGLSDEVEKDGIEVGVARDGATG